MKSFTKRNSTKYDDALLAEYKGLLQLQKVLEENGYIKTPEIINYTPQELETEFIQSSAPTNKQMRELGIGLATMHKNIYELYGLNYNNYIGLNPQKNGISSNWGEFFIENRLFFQINMIKNSEIKKEFTALLEKHSSKLEIFLNQTTKHPSLVHGDLWSGNVMFSKTDIFVIDPAIHFADREVDIAMTEMFGGFQQSFYDSYNETYPLSKEYPIKKEVYNLYHFLNHYNLFGHSYLNDCIKGFKLIENL